MSNFAVQIGELLDFSSFANDVGVDGKTIKEWISFLEKMQIIYRVLPFYSNLSKRLIKSPKVYFYDNGLACRLQGWSDPIPMMTSPQFGHLFKNLVFSEIIKFKNNFQKDFNVYHWRSRDGEEIDFLIHDINNKSLFIEAKVSPQSLKNHQEFTEVKKIFGDKILNNFVPISKLTDF